MRGVGAMPGDIRTAWQGLRVDSGGEEGGHTIGSNGIMKCSGVRG